jgi:hypothetical protein
LIGKAQGPTTQIGAPFLQSPSFSTRIANVRENRGTRFQAVLGSDCGHVQERIRGTYGHGLAEVSVGLGVAQVWAGKEDARPAKIHWSQPSPQSIHSRQTDRKWGSAPKDQVPELLAVVRPVQEVDKFGVFPAIHWRAWRARFARWSEINISSGVRSLTNKSRR